jgi:hypothetical protein
MKKVIRLTESDLMRIVKRVINEEVAGVNTQDPISYFDKIIKHFKMKGFRVDTSKVQSMGTITLIKNYQNKTNLTITLVSPSHPYSKTAGYVVRLSTLNNGKPSIIRDYKINEFNPDSVISWITDRHNNYESAATPRSRYAVR